MPRAAEPAPTSRSSKGAAKPKKARARPPGADDQLRLTGDRLIVRTPDSGERKSSGGLLIPATAMPAPKRLMWADVALVGPDVRVAKLGDRVLFLPQSGLEVELDGDEVLLLRERDIQAVQSPSMDGKDHPPGQYL
jgi:chaperonin GroES